MRLSLSFILAMLCWEEGAKIELYHRLYCHNIATFQDKYKNIILEP